MGRHNSAKADDGNHQGTHGGADCRALASTTGAIRTEVVTIATVPDPWLHG